MKISLRIIIHPKVGEKSLTGEFTLVGDISHLSENFQMAKLAYEIEQKLNESINGIRAHIDIIE